MPSAAMIRMYDGVLRGQDGQIYRFAPRARNKSIACRALSTVVRCLTSHKQQKQIAQNVVISSTKTMQDQIQEMACFGDIFYLLITVVRRSLEDCPGLDLSQRVLAFYGR